MPTDNRARLYLFGSPRLEQVDGRTPVRRRKSLALLAYLATNGEPISREKCAAMFWTDLEPPAARANLRKTLLEIRTGCGDALDDSEPDMVGPVSSDVWVDAAEFQRLLAEQRSRSRRAEPSRDLTNLLERAVELYNGDFMSGFDIAGCDEFEEWRFFHGEYLKQELCTALDLLAERSEQVGDLVNGIRHARRLVSVAPLHEEAHRALMRMLSRAGQQAAAERQYDICTRLLRKELGVDPEDETRELFASVRSGKYRSGRTSFRPVDVKEAPGEPASTWAIPDGASPRQVTAASDRATVSAFSPATADFDSTPRIAVVTAGASGPDADLVAVVQEAVVERLDLSDGLFVVKPGGAVRLGPSLPRMRVATELRADYLLVLSTSTDHDAHAVEVDLYEAAVDSVARHARYIVAAEDSSDVMAAAEQVAGDVAGQLRASPIEMPEVETNADARQLCALASYHIKTCVYEQSGNDLARSYYGQAMQIDPECADAYAGVAFSYFMLGGNVPDVRYQERLTVNIDALVDRALELDPDNAVALMVRAGKLFEWDWDVAGAEAAFDEALSKHPTHTDTLVWCGKLLKDTGRFEQAGELYTTALEQSPIDLYAMYRFARLYEAQGLYRKADEMLKRIQARYPGRSHAQVLEIHLLIDLGRFDEAAAVAHAYATKRPSTLTLFNLAQAYAAGGRTRNARQVIRQILEIRRPDEDPYMIGQAYHLLREETKAIEWLDIAIRDRDVDCLITAVDYRWGRLHFTDDFQQRIRRIGLPLCTDYIESALARIAPNQAW